MKTFVMFDMLDIIWDGIRGRITYPIPCICLIENEKRVGITFPSSFSYLLYMKLNRILFLISLMDET